MASQIIDFPLLDSNLTVLRSFKKSKGFHLDHKMVKVWQQCREVINLKIR